MLVSNDITEHLNDPRPSVALNLMGLSLIAKNPSYEKDCIFWIDGILGELFCRYKGLRIEKKRGSLLYTELVEFLSSSENGDLVVLGEAGGYPKLMKALSNFITIVELPHYKSDGLIDLTPLSLPLNNNLVVIGIGSPKQEMVAQKLYKEQKRKVFCFGGALNMYEHRERAVPDGVFGRYFEWFWRLQNQPIRRIKRTLIFFIPAILMFTKRHLKVRTFNSIFKGKVN